MLEFVNFEYLLKDIIRGVQVKAEELNKLKTNLNTGYYYLMLSHITKGVLDLDNNPQYLRNIPRNYDKYCIEDESLLISKIGLPLKTVVVGSLGNKKVLATGNVYIAKIDTSKINIYYLQAFLQSEQGIESLKKIAKGENIKNISLKQLMTLRIPVPTLAKQEMIANEYKQLLNEIKDLKKKIKVVENNFSSLWLSGIDKKESEMKTVLFNELTFKTIWVDEKDIFYKTAWQILEEAGLTSYNNEKERHLVLSRQLVLEKIYGDFSEIAYDELYERDYSHIEDELSEDIVKELYDELFKDDTINSNFESMIESLMFSEYSNVVDLLMKKKTTEELFKLLASVNFDEENYDDGIEYEDESDRNATPIFDHITYSNIQMWLSDKMQK